MSSEKLRTNPMKPALTLPRKASEDVAFALAEKEKKALKADGGDHGGKLISKRWLQIYAQSIYDSDSIELF